MKIEHTKEHKRLQNSQKNPAYGWKRWGPYLSDRAWGTVREDYSSDGNAWSSFPHDHARSRVFRWGEDGIAGICDRYQVALLSFAFWNEKDPYLKERFFGLTTWEGNHGEDVKEYYYHIDATPTFSYAKFLYKYPIQAYPYDELLKENQKRNSKEREFELADTGIFDQDEYFDIFIEYAKENENDIAIRLEIFNRSNNQATLHVVPQLTFRNQWSWEDEKKPEPEMGEESHSNSKAIYIDDSKMLSPGSLAFDYHLNKHYFYGSQDCEALFTNNETNFKRLWGQENRTPYVKDAFHEKIVNGKEKAVNPEKKGTKACLHQKVTIEPKQSKVFFFRLSNERLDRPLEGLEELFSTRKNEADTYYEAVQPSSLTEEDKKIQRQAFSAMIWSQQIYLFDVSRWLVGDSKKSPPPDRSDIRNNHWRHLNSMRIFSMPDKWEYPWFAAWDLAFHTTTFAYIDLAFAKEQLWLLLFDQFQHPNGQIPAYEWEYSDVNPPVQAWALLHIFKTEEKLFGSRDYPFLEKCFHKLLLNFSWWINKIDASGKNVFEGGFLGLDNITVIDRSSHTIDGQLDEADGAGWMAMFCFNLMTIALLLSEKDPIYESLATKFFEHYVYIAAALRKGYWRGYDMLDAKDFFFYSVLRKNDGNFFQFRIRSLVGIIPLFASGVLDEDYIKRFPEFYQNFHWFCDKREHLIEKCIETISSDGKKRYLFSLIAQSEMPHFLKYLWDANEFRSDYGIRSLSKFHEKNVYSYDSKSVGYEPGESLVRIKGGNSNWRGPIWLPTSYLLVDILHSLAPLLKDIRVEVDGEQAVSISQMADGFSERLISLFRKNREGIRPIYSGDEKLMKDPLFSEYLLFYEHYHGDTGRGLGATHQTGWGGLVANLIQEINKKR